MTPGAQPFPRLITVGDQDNVRVAMVLGRAGPHEFTPEQGLAFAHQLSEACKRALVYAGAAS